MIHMGVSCLVSVLVATSLAVTPSPSRNATAGAFSTLSTPISAYSWVQLGVGNKSTLRRDFRRWSTMGGRGLVVDVSALADIVEMRRVATRERRLAGALRSLRLVQSAALHWGLDVVALAGNPDWFTPARSYVVPGVLTALTRYNETAQVPIKALEVDVEPWSRDGTRWHRRSYLDGLTVALDHARSLGKHSPALGVAVPYWFDDPANPMGLGPDSETTLFSMLVDRLAVSRGSFVTLMDYRARLAGSGGLADSVADGFRTVQGSDVAVNIALNLAPSDEHGSTLDGVTSEGLAVILRELEDSFGSSGHLANFRVNDLESLLRLKE